MKAKFEQIDLTQISEKGKKVLLAIKKQTKNFTEVTEGQRNVFNKLYDKIKQTKPEAIKPRKSKAKKSTKRKVTGKQGVFMKLAKSIRDKNPNLTWKQAQAKASAELKESRERETKKLNFEIERFVRNNKEYQKAFGSSTSNLQKDAKQPAKKIGKRVSKSGKTYYEYRRNRTDLSPQGFPMLEKGGEIDYRTATHREIMDDLNEKVDNNDKKGFDEIWAMLYNTNRDDEISRIIMTGFPTKAGKDIQDVLWETALEARENKFASHFAKGGKVKAKKEIVEGLEKLEVGLAGASKKHKQQSKLAKQIKDGFESSFEKGGMIKSSDLSYWDEKLNEGEEVVVYDKNGVKYIYQGSAYEKSDTMPDAVAVIKGFDESTYKTIPLSDVKSIEIGSIFKKGGKTQGYNDKLDESLGMRKRKKVIRKQSYKDRRDESKGMEKSMGRRAYQSVGTMDKMAKGGKVSAIELEKVIKKKKLKGMDLPLFKVIGGKVNHYPMGSKIEPIKKAEYIRAKSPQEASEKYTQIHNNMVMSSELDDDRWVAIHFAKGGRVVSPSNIIYVVRGRDKKGFVIAEEIAYSTKDAEKKSIKMTLEDKGNKIVDIKTEIFKPKNFAKGGEISMNRFFEVAKKVGLVKDGKYVGGTPKGSEKDINEFYNLEDRLDYPEPQKIYAKGGKVDDLGNPTDPKVIKKMESFIEKEIPKLDKEKYFTDGMKRKEAKNRFYKKYRYGAYHPNFSFDFFAKGGKVKKDYTEFYEKGGSVKEIEVGNVFSLYNHRDNEMIDVKVKEQYKSILGTNTIKFDDVDGEELVLSEHIFREVLRDNGYKEYAKGGKISMPKEIKEKFFEEDGTPKSDEKTYRELFEYSQKLPDTKSKHYNTKTGKYSKSRQKLHKEITNEFKDDAVCIERDEPIAILMGGSPASGKSTFLRSYAPFLLKDEILRIDADEVRGMLPEYEGWNSDSTHRETKDIVETLLSDKTIGIPCKTDIIYDGTMNNVKRYTPLVKFLKKQGYKVFVVYIDNVPKKEIEERIRGRYKRSGRYVPLEVVDDFFQKGKKALNVIKKEADGYMIVDGGSKNYKVIEKGGFKIPTDRKYSKLGTPLKKRINRN